MKNQHWQLWESSPMIKRTCHEPGKREPQHASGTTQISLLSFSHPSCTYDIPLGPEKPAVSNSPAHLPFLSSSPQSFSIGSPFTYA